MRFLFIVQGEGRGHLTQAITLSGILRRNGHEVVEVLLGESVVREIPSFFRDRIGCPLVQTFATFSFKYRKNNKQVDLLRSILFNTEIRQLNTYKKSIRFIHKRISEQKPDVVVNFFEILSGFSRLIYKQKTPVVNIGHQFLLNHPDYPFGKMNNYESKLLKLHVLLNNICANKSLALSFYPLPDYPDEQIFVAPPLLRREVLEIQPSEEDYILIYMLNPGYESEVREWHRRNPTVRLYCFWDKKQAPAEWKVDDSLTFFTIDDTKFIRYMAGCRGYVSTAGFESICEAFYLDKPVMMIPAHVEQEINAQDAASTGYGIVANRFDIDQLLSFLNTCPPRSGQFKAWVDSAEKIFLRQLCSL
ncbi:MAG: hypothetical protein LBP25_01775 [Tannerellaceae bacterium]|jgi:uncharacterized protein (TIGR00661 family)|nr:hypothetical protein [Tannerellaceae bacterium]